MRVAIVILAAVWAAAALLVFVRTRETSADARLTAAYIVGYPVLAVALLLNDPIPLWIGVPVVFGFIPWLMAGPHLWQVLRDPSRRSPDEWVGIPKSYWLWGGLGAVLIGIVFG